MNIFTKLFLLLAVVSAVPLGLTAALGMRQSAELQRHLQAKNAETSERTTKISQEALEEQARRTHQQVVQEKAAQLHEFFTDIRHAVELEAQILEHCLDEDPPKHLFPIYDSEKAAALLSNPDSDFSRTVHSKLPYLVFHLAPGTELAKVQSQLHRVNPVAAFLANNQKSMPWCKSAYFALREGVMVTYPGREKYQPDYDPRLRPWYTKAAERKTTAWTDIYMDRNGKDLVMTCSHPIFSADGSELLAVTAIDVQLQKIIDQLFELRELPVTDALLMDGNGSIRISRAQQKAADGKLPRAIPVSEFQGGEFVPVYEAISKARDQATGIVTVPGGAMFAYGTVAISATSGKIYYVVKTPLDIIIGPARAIQSKLDESHQELADEIRHRVRALGLHLLAIILGVVLASLGVAYLTARASTRPLVHMSEVVHRIGKGDLAHHVVWHSRDEFGTMGDAINEMIKGLKERDFVKSTFKKFVTATVVEKLLKNPESVRLGGEKRVMTVFFSDLAGFTSISERLNPEDLVVLINEYFGAMTDAIFSHEGTIDKYDGDAIMAFWGAPVDQADHALRACRAALDNVAALRRLWPDWERRGLPKLGMRIGINTGPMVVGNMGSTAKMDYTVMGDSVNLGSRLEGVNKVYGTCVMISEATRLEAGDAIEVRELDTITVQGKHKAVRIYELLGLAGQVPADRREGCRQFEAGLAAYRARKWDEAEAAFRRAIEILGDDGPSRGFVERIRAYRISPPSPEWDGTFLMQMK